MERDPFDYKIAERKPRGPRPVTTERIVVAITFVVMTSGLAIVLLQSRRIAEQDDTIAALSERVAKLEQTVSELEEGRRMVPDPAAKTSDPGPEIGRLSARITSLEERRDALGLVLDFLRRNVRKREGGPLASDPSSR